MQIVKSTYIYLMHLRRSHLAASLLFGERHRSRRRAFSNIVNNMNIVKMLSEKTAAAKLSWNVNVALTLSAFPFLPLLPLLWRAFTLPQREWLILLRTKSFHAPIYTWLGSFSGSRSRFRPLGRREMPFSLLRLHGLRFDGIQIERKT